MKPLGTFLGEAAFPSPPHLPSRPSCRDCCARRERVRHRPETEVELRHCLTRKCSERGKRVSGGDGRERPPCAQVRAAPWQRWCVKDIRGDRKRPQTREAGGGGYPAAPAEAALQPLREAPPLALTERRSACTRPAVSREENEAAGCGAERGRGFYYRV